MFEYEKVIIQKVSYNKDLFKEELTKTILDLNNDEIDKFKRWVNDNFFHTHYKEIAEVF